MSDVIGQYMPWVLSGITVWQLLLAGNQKPYAWAVMLGNQALWLTWIITSAEWGLLPMNIALWIVAVRNHWKWSQRTEPTHD